jgi:hypothetical protein
MAALIAHRARGVRRVFGTTRGLIEINPPGPARL